MSEKPIKLTKKQQKAAAFRTKKKGKAILEEPSAFPEADEEENEPIIPSKSTKETKDKSEKIIKSNKRKREDNTSTSKTNKTNEEEEGEEGDKVIGAAAIRRKRKKAAQARKYEEEKIKKSSKLILFVGNLPFDMTSEKLTSFFLEHCEEEPEVRLMTHKSTKNETGQPTNATKGCGFVEFKTSAALQKALRLHHTPMNCESTGQENQKKSRKINIELTAGGGGKSESRLKKIEVSKERLNKQREKRIEKNLKEITEKRLKYGLEALEPGEEDVTVKFGSKKKSEEAGLEEGKANWGSKSSSGPGASTVTHSSKSSRFKGRPQSSGANSIRLT
ncbi:uncharacterized protein MELLADRAFT_110457 [Melampsora larici-populina 98AG31]|uniref:RRM domain-containing protein n=1 Tax=Melampsora larici-populina (strain 98AG31 / pathotype 3-4-7) TaxID=747676 RepID=F4RZV6_MELLP|nr:uncharacterized protein MELLADRAFT_110457 [Melampsora larici-populina 98AG31]EGG02068.1 hypothetical protein MELLADRAFT_110457 [Melampsora larici-populina 98AG31]